MATIEVTPLFSLEMQIDGAPEVVGAIPQGARSIGNVSGHFEGPGIKGTIHACDWYLSRSDGFGDADVRGTMLTDDGALIYMHYTGLVDMREATLPGAGPGKGTSRVRTAVRFETGAERYRSLNQVQAIGIGEVSFETGHIKYQIYGL